MRAGAKAMSDDERLKRDEATVRQDFWRKLAAEPPTISIYSGEEVRFADFIAS